MNQNNQGLIKASVIVVIIAGILGALSVMTEGIGLASGKMFSICLSLIIFGITGAICMVVAEKPAYKTLGTSGMVVSAVGFLLISVMILGATGSEGLLKLAFALLISSIALAHICLLHHFTLQNKYAGYARITATIAIAVFALMIIIRVFEPITSFYALAYNQSTLKIIVASLIIDLAATLLVPLCNRLEADEPVELELTQAPPPAQNEQTPL